VTLKHEHSRKLAHSIDEATEYLPFGKSTTRKFVNSGELKSFKVGNLRLIGHDTLVRFVHELETAGYTPTPSNKKGEVS
jgi:excisionase family DNA binding protein